MMMLAACHNANGSPELVRVTIPYPDPESYALGFQYDIAIEILEANGYEKPMVIFDIGEIPEYLDLSKVPTI